MFSYPKISIITPSYNQGQYIEQTILSVIGQGYPNLEYIIIDGGSTDNTVEIIKKYANKINYWISESDKGQSDALIKGLEKCTGDIFNWINSDDYLEQDSLFKIAQYFINNPSIEMLCGYCTYFESKTLVQTFLHRSEIFESVEETLIQQKINQPASFYKLSIIKQLGGINKELHYCMDLELWFRYLVQFGQRNILLVDDLFAHFRLHDESKTVQLQVRFREEERLLWHHMLLILGTNKNIVDFFSVNKSYTFSIPWKPKMLNKKLLINKICRTYFFELYKQGHFSAAKYAFWNLMKNNQLQFKKTYLGIFYNLYFKLNRA